MNEHIEIKKITDEEYRAYYKVKDIFDMEDILNYCNEHEIKIEDYAELKDILELYQDIDINDNFGSNILFAVKRIKEEKNEQRT